MSSAVRSYAPQLFAFACFAGKNDGLDGAGSDVVFGLQIDFFQAHPHVKDFGDALFIRTSAVAATHGSHSVVTGLRNTGADSHTTLRT